VRRAAARTRAGLWGDASAGGSRGSGGGLVQTGHEGVGTPGRTCKHREEAIIWPDQVVRCVEGCVC
jgi:hypothetical protein